MKKILSYLSLLFLSCLVLNLNAQNCTVNAGIPQTICVNSTLTLQGQTNGSFQGGSPNITWSQVSGPLTTITSPNSTTTTVTGLVAGTYVYQISTTCLDGSVITDNVTITARPIVQANAGLDATSCPGTLALSANSPSPGTGAWTIIGTNNGVSFSSSTSPTTNITLSPNSAGNTTLRWTITQNTSGTTCTSFDDVVITNRGGVATVNAGNDITLNNCYTTTQSTTLSGSFAGTNFGQQGTWSQVSGPNSASFSNVNAYNATASNLIEGTYVFRWTVSGACVNGSDDVRVIVPAPTSSLTSIGSISNQSFCDGRTSTVLTATQPAFAGETAQWSVITGSGTFSNPTSYSTTVTGIGTGTNTYRYRITNASGCTAFRDVTVNNVTAPTVNITTASPVTLGCGTSTTTINFTTTGGTGSTQYRIIAAPSGFTLPTTWSNTNTSTSVTLTGLTVPGTYLVRVNRIGTSDCAAAFKDITVIVSQTPTLSNAGTDQLLACNVTSTALAGNIPSRGTGSWSQVSGPNTAVISNPGLYNTPISGLVPGAYNFKWIINAGNGCTPSEDIVTVRVANTAPTTANAGADRTGICHTGPTQLDGNAVVLNEVGTWTVSPSSGISFSNINDPKAIVSGMAGNTSYTFTWTIVNGCGSSSDDLVISTSGTQGASQAMAGADRCLPSATTMITMAANAPTPAGTVGTWSVVSGPNTPTFSNLNSASSTVNGLVQGTYVFAWSLDVSGCGAVSDTMIATISPAITVSNAGPAQTVCAANVTLAANSPSIGSGIWTQESGPGGATFSDLNAYNAVVNGLTPGLYKFRWTISSGACSNNSDVLITVSTLPTPASIAADSTCITKTTLIALAGNAPENGVGTWSQVSGPNMATITNMSSPTSGLSGLINGNYIFRWTINGGGGCAASTADMNVSVNIPTTSISNVNVCNVTSATLTGNANIGGVWNQTAGPSASSIQSIAPNIGNITNLQPGTYSFQFTPNPVAGCATLTSRTVTLNNNAPASPSVAGNNQALCNVNTFSLNANTPIIGTGTWSRISGPNSPAISSATSTSPTITGAVPGLYTYRWTITNGGCTSADDVTVTINAPVTVSNAGSDESICANGGIITLNANAPSVGAGSWSQLSGPVSGSISNPSMNNTSINGLTTEGIYSFRWTITNGACSSNDDVAVQVDAIPTSFAGNDTTISTDTYTLKASTPTAGTGIWSQLNGPSSTITNINDANTNVTGLQPGNTYTYRWTVTNGAACTPASSDVVITVTSALPLKITSFNGQLKGEESYLSWKISDAKNVSHFDIERSYNGIDFKKSGIVKFYDGQTAYSYSELFPANVERCYYRLRILDLDGQYKFSSTIQIVTGNTASDITVLPNPVQERIIIQVKHTNNEDAMLKVANKEGKIICQRKLRIQSGNQIISLDESANWPAGVYQLFITTSKGKQLRASAMVVR